MLLCHFKFSFKKDKLNFHFIGTLSSSAQKYFCDVLSYCTNEELRLQLIFMYMVHGSMRWSQNINCCTYSGFYPSTFLGSGSSFCTLLYLILYLTVLYLYLTVPHFVPYCTSFCTSLYFILYLTVLHFYLGLIIVDENVLLSVTFLI